MSFTITDVLLVSSLLACLFAFVAGGAAERIGAAAISASLIAATASYVLFHSQLIDLCIDAAAALVLLAVALRYASPWLGVVMLIYALQFGLDAYYFVTDRPLDLPHAVINNMDSAAITLALAAGAATAWMRRRRPAPDEVPAAAP